MTHSKNPLTKNEWFVLVGAIVLLVIMFWLLSFTKKSMAKEVDNKMNLCHGQGYDYWEPSTITEDGYISCCTSIYTDHIKVDAVCAGFEYI